MKNQSLIIKDNDILYDILNEISDQLNFSVTKVFKKDLIITNLTNNINYLVLTKKVIPKIKNQILINKFPLNIFRLIEKLNIEFLKLEFNNQSDIKIRDYIFNINSREMKNHNYNLKLTEKEISTIIYLFRAKKPVKVNELQLEVWGHQSDLETHTVETHIYRLRKKILNKFKDSNFIFSTTSGYEIK
jgi:hypothetical protein